jgi:hypothetical protein
MYDSSVSHTRIIFELSGSDQFEGADWHRHIRVIGCNPVVDALLQIDPVLHKRRRIGQRMLSARHDLNAPMKSSGAAMRSMCLRLKMQAAVLRRTICLKTRVS